MKVWEIWIEGYAATGEHATASKIGEWPAETFEEACRSFRYQEDIVREYDGKVIVLKGSPLLLDKGKLSIWGCRLFDNEADARKYFG